MVFRIDEEVERELKHKLGKWDGLLTARSEEQFESVLRVIFNSWSTRRVIYSLLAQNERPNQPGGTPTPVPDRCSRLAKLVGYEF